MNRSGYGLTSLFGFAIPLLVFACASDDAPANLEDAELQRLLAADSAKVWQRMSRRENGTNTTLPDCEIDNVLIFSLAESSEDTVTINYETGPLLCSGESDSLIFQGAWDIFSSDIPEVYDSLRLIIAGDTSLRNIDFITSQMLMLSYEEEASGQVVQVVESYQFIP
ncbi:MAG: hypothetical protein ACR2MX_10485 [Cyclobacteriaceae bacterium]